MKKLTPILILSLLFLSCGDSQKDIHVRELVKMDNGLYTKKFSDEPITGKVYGLFGEDYHKKRVDLGNLRDGKKEGKWVWYYHSTGKKGYKNSYKDGKLDGLSTEWYENGQMKYKGTYKNGKLDGLSTWWYENGQKEWEGTFNDGKQDGLYTIWWENGQMKSEVTFKNGNLISSTIWNEDGSVKE